MLPTSKTVVIIGAGPTGLSAANLFGMAGIETLLLERNTSLVPHARAIAIDDEGLRVCQALGLQESILPDTLLNIQADYMSTGRYLARVAPTSQRNGYPLISTFHQPNLEQALFNGLQRFSCVQVCFGYTLETVEQDERSVNILVRYVDGSQQQVQCSYLLGGDGGKSTVRRLLNIPMIAPRIFTTVKQGQKSFTREVSMRNAQRWLVVDCNEEEDKGLRSIIFFCDPQRPAVTVAAPGQRRRWEFMLLPGEQPDDLLNDGTIQQLISTTLLRHKLIQTLPTSPQITRKAIYTFHALLAQRFSQDRVFLLGDAAHLMPPFGGQGMNTGLRDVHNLCWKIALILKGHAQPALLKSYEQERLPHVAQMILFSATLGQLIMPLQRSKAFLRDLCLRGLINPIAPLRTTLSEMKVKPQPRYKQGFLVPTSKRKLHTLIGAFLPQPYVTTAEGKEVLLDDVLGNAFALLKYSQEPEDAFAGLKEDIWKQLQVKFVCVKTKSTHAPIGTTFMQSANGNENLSGEKQENRGVLTIWDSKGVLHAFLQQRTDIYVLVRPDRYVMGIFSVQEEQQFVEQVKRMLQNYS